MNSWRLLIGLFACLLICARSEAAPFFELFDGEKQPVKGESRDEAIARLGHPLVSVGAPDALEFFSKNASQVESTNTRFRNRYSNEPIGFVLKQSHRFGLKVHLSAADAELVNALALLAPKRRLHVFLEGKYEWWGCLETMGNGEGIKLYTRRDYDALVTRSGIAIKGPHQSTRESLDAIKWRHTFPPIKLPQAVAKGWLTDPVGLEAVPDSFYFPREPVQVTMTWQCRPVIDQTIKSKINMYPNGYLIIPPVGGSLSKVFHAVAENPDGDLTKHYRPFQRKEKKMTTIQMGDSLAVRLNLARDLAMPIPDSPGEQEFDIFASALFMHDTFPSEHRIGPIFLKLKVIPFDEARFEPQSETEVTFGSDREAAAIQGIYKHPEHGQLDLLVIRSKGKIIRILKLRVPAPNQVRAKPLEIIWDQKSARFHVISNGDAGLPGKYLSTDSDFAGLTVRKELDPAKQYGFARDKAGNVSVVPKE